MTDSIQYLIEWDPQQSNVLFSVFFHDSGHGVVHGLYYGYAGSQCWDDAFFRMVVGKDGHVQHFLECDNPTDQAFRLDRANGDYAYDQARLDDNDTRTFAMLQTCRSSWWRFTEDDDIRMKPARLKELRAGHEPYTRSACSASLNWILMEQISANWSLQISIRLPPRSMT